ncbi:MAG: cation:proton antiporter [Solirubrobacterales bacterium]|nr:cation:proton antiporter [Solirubrobacterales bacterium]
MSHAVTIATAPASSLNHVLLVLGVLLMAGALLAGLARRGFLSMVALYVITGLVVGESGFGWLHFSASSPFVSDLTVIALVVILFRDGIEVEGEILKSSWVLPARKLVLAMPITAAVIAAVAHTVVGLTWTEGFLLGALLAPTDPVLSSSVVTNPRVPAVIRNSLNLESGLNDGLALPAVLALVAVLDHQKDFSLGTFLLQDVGGGVLAGLALAWIAAKLMPSGMKDIKRHLISLYALGSALFIYAFTVLVINGNGLIAVFVGAITLGLLRTDIADAFVERADDIVEIVKLTVFVVFGATVSLSSMFSWAWPAVAIVLTTFLVARPLGVGISLAGSGLDRQTKAFMAWFGPKGVATMSFSLLVLGRLSGSQEIFDMAALCVLVSIIAHGLSDVPGAKWIAKHAATNDEAARAGQATA